MSTLFNLFGIYTDMECNPINPVLRTAIEKLCELCDSFGIILTWTC